MGQACSRLVPYRAEDDCKYWERCPADCNLDSNNLRGGGRRSQSWFQIVGSAKNPQLKVTNSNPKSIFRFILNIGWSTLSVPLLKAFVLQSKSYDAHEKHIKLCKTKRTTKSKKNKFSGGLGDELVGSAGLAGLGWLGGWLPAKLVGWLVGRLAGWPAADQQEPEKTNKLMNEQASKEQRNQLTNEVAN